MDGLSQIGLKLLVNDRGKFFTLIVGITFAVFLMLQMNSVFVGLMQRASSHIINIGAPVWVIDPSVNIETDNIPLPDYLLDLVRSVRGVQYAMPVFVGNSLARLSDGRYQPITVVGLDDASLFGRPTLISGNMDYLFNDDSYIVLNDTEYPKLNSPKINATFEINDRRSVIVGIGKAGFSNIFGLPTLYTLYTRAISATPHLRFTISYILVQPKSNGDIRYIQRQVKKFGYLALTKQQFINRNIRYYLFHTGLGANVFIITIVSFIVGLSVAGQTFYSFIIENIMIFAALKAIGAIKPQLSHIILFQSAVVGFLGYGFGILLMSLLIAFAKINLPNYAAVMTLLNLGISFLLVLFIISISSYFGIRKVLHVDSFDIFRG